MKCVVVCLAVLVFAAALLTDVAAVDRNKFKKCSESSFCRRHRGLAPSKTPFQYVINKPSLSLDGSKLSGVVEEQVSKTQLSMELSLLASNIVHLRMDEKNPLTDMRRYRVKDVINDTTAHPQAWKSWDASTSVLEFEGGKVVMDAATFKMDFYYGDSLAVTLNDRGLFYVEPLGVAKPSENAQAEADADKSEEKEEAAEVEYGPDGKVIHGKREHVGAVDRDLHEGAETTEATNPNDHLYGMETEPTMNVDEYLTTAQQIAMDGAWDEHFKGHHDLKKRGPESLGMDVTFHGAKHIYGLPEHAIALDLPATKGEGTDRDPYRLFNLDVFEYELDSEMALYGAVPILYAHDAEKTSAILWLNAAETWVDIEKPLKLGGVVGLMTDPNGEEKVLSHFMSETGIVDIYIMLGSNPKEILEKYRLLTGGSELPPLSTVGYHQCRWNYRDEADVADINQKFEDHQLPMDYIWLDIEHTDGKRYFTWDGAHFPTPQKMLAKMAEYGRSMVTIVDPHIKRDDNYHVHSEATKLGYYVKNSNGHDYDGHCWPGSSSYLDFFRPEVCEWFSAKFGYSSYKGSAPNLFIWNDMNEPSVFSGPEVSMPRDNLHMGDVEHRHVHNQYGMKFHLSTAEGLVARDHISNVHDRRRPFVLSRAFFVGSQKRGVAIWTGDNTADWGHLKASVPMVMTLGLGGIPFTGADIGGFFRDPNAELITRWYQLGAFYPFMRAHGHIDTKRREPWVFGEPYLSHIRDALRLRYQILPYFYTQFHYAYEHLTPILRPLFIEYPKDPITFGMESTFLVGRDLLVHPVTTEGAPHVDVYLPGLTKDVWYDYTTLHRYHAGRIITVETPLSYTPIFQRGGSIVTTKDRVRRSSVQMKDDPFTLRIALDENQSATGTLYLDDGETFQYQNNKYELLTFHYEATTPKTHVLSVSKSTKSGEVSIKNTVNRVSILGVESAPKQASLSVDGQVTPVEFDFIKDSHMVVLRNPGQIANADWSIELSF